MKALFQGDIEWSEFATLLQSHDFVRKSSPAAWDSVDSACVVNKLGHFALRLRHVGAVLFLVAVHALRVLCYLGVLHKVGLRAHVGVLLRRLNWRADWLRQHSGTLRCLWPHKVSRSLCLFVRAKSWSVVARELSSWLLRVESSICQPFLKRREGN